LVIQRSASAGVVIHGVPVAGDVTHPVTQDCRAGQAGDVRISGDIPLAGCIQGDVSQFCSIGRVDRPGKRGAILQAEAERTDLIHGYVTRKILPIGSEDDRAAIRTTGTPLAPLPVVMTVLFDILILLPVVANTPASKP
jgi:hypothetical protein